MSHRKHRHSSRNVFPTLVQAPSPVVCGACRSGYRGSHPGRACFTPDLVYCHSEVRRIERALEHLRTGVTLRTVRTEIDDSLRRLHLTSLVMGDVASRIPEERDFSPTAVWTNKPTPAHIALPGCECIECKLDTDTMPLWAQEWLNRGSQADLPIQVVDTTCGK